MYSIWSISAELQNLKKVLFYDSSGVLWRHLHLKMIWVAPSLIGETFYIEKVSGFMQQFTKECHNQNQISYT